MKNYSYKMYGPDPDFDEETASDREKAQQWWGDDTVDPNTGTHYNDDGERYNPDTGRYESDDY